MSEKEELAVIVGDANVSDTPEALEAYSRDESFVRRMKPQLVAKPQNVDEVQEIVKWANSTGTPLIPVSSGPPHFRGDTVPSLGGVVVDLSRMKRIIRINRRNRVAMVEPGVTFAELQLELKNEGMRLPMPLCPRSSKSVIGSCLEREPTIIPKYQWDISDPLLCTEVVFGTGDLFRTGEAAGPGSLEDQWASGQAQTNAMGPFQVDFFRLIQGSQGTMGILTWATVKCELLPRLQKTFLVASQRLEDLLDFTYKLLWARLGDELLILNNFNLATLLAENPDEIKSLRETLPPWVLIVCVAGYERLPEERVDYQEKDVMDTAQRFGVKPVTAIDGVQGSDILEALSTVSAEPYWKLRYKGRFHDIFFLTTLGKTPEFIACMDQMAAEAEYPGTDFGVYLQPQIQGRACHCEFSLSYDPANPKEFDKVQKLFFDASKALMGMGGFFSRPYGPWAEMAYSRDGQSAMALRKVKGIFDPNNVMNPGKLCF
ncbi:MAG: FAD-binding oxidoreductase [Dehalococcoidia bacterium]|nr:FAD-binding oxidoreductase [Dehalococcoidia bacterium]